MKSDESKLKMVLNYFILIWQFFQLSISIKAYILIIKEYKMLEFLKRRLKSEKGAMDKIIVTLLLVIVGVGAVVGLTSWLGDQTTAVEGAATTKIQEVTNETTGTTTTGTTN
jgi:hypothetical protein